MALKLKHIVTTFCYLQERLPRSHFCQARTYAQRFVSKELLNITSITIRNVNTSSLQRTSQASLAASFRNKRSASVAAQANNRKSRHAVNDPVMVEMHKVLMNSVTVFPMKTQESVKFSERDLEAVTPKELLSLAQGITSVDKETMKVIMALWRNFDAMSVEEMLTAADIFYIKGVSTPWYTSALFTYVEEMFEHLTFTPQQLTRLMFHTFNHGSAPPTLLLNIEKRMSDRIDDFHINQVAIIFQLFFIGQNRIRSILLIDKIADKLLKDFDKIDKWFLPMVLKMFRFSNFIKLSFYKQLGDKLVSSGCLIKFRSPAQHMHCAFTYASVRITHPQLFSHILKSYQKMPLKQRLKDVSRIIWACGTLVTTQPQHLQSIQALVDNVRESITQEQVLKYPDNLADLLTGLAMLNIYPQDLYNLLFDPSTVKVLLGLRPDREKFLQLEFLHHSLTIECPQYSGHSLNEKDMQHIKKKLKHLSVEVDSQFRKPIQPALTALQKEYGSQNVYSAFVLPHFKTSDILLEYDQVKKAFIQPSQDPLLHLNKRGTTLRLVLILLSRNQMSFDGKPLGMLHCKLRQLDTLGYKVIPIDADEGMSYTFLDLETTQALLKQHVSVALDS